MKTSSKKIKSKFNQFHEYPEFYSDNTLVISAELYTKEQATRLLLESYEDYYKKKAEPSNVKEDRVRYQITNDSDYGDKPTNIWQLGAKGKGSKPVYILN